MNNVSWNSPNNPPPIGKRVRVLLKDPLIARDASGCYEDGACIWNGKAWFYCDMPMLPMVTRQVMGWKE